MFLREERRAPAGALLAFMALACSSLHTGTPVDQASIPNSPVVLKSALTTEPNGLRVLWNGPVLGRDFEQRGLIAADGSQFDSLWQEVGAPQREPAVDFSQYVVLASVGEGAECPWEVLAVDLEPNDVLRVRTTGDFSCSDVAVRRALVLAVPRRLLGASVTFVERGAFSFDIPEPGRAVALAPSPSAPTPQTVPQGDSISIPERGWLSLRTLTNGTQVWVVHHGDGSLNVLAATVATKNLPRTELVPFLWQVLSYSQDQGRFIGGYDARGRSVHGWPPIQAFAWTRVDEAHIQLAGTASTGPAPIQPREAAPRLEGPARAYSDLPARAWTSIQQGHVALLDADLVVRDQGVAELCQAPEPSESLRFFRECPAGSPTVLGSPMGKPPHLRAHVLYGPLVVQRRGQAASVIVTGPPQLRSLPSPAAGPCPLRTRRGEYPGYRVEWTYEDAPNIHRELCDPRGTLIILDSVILRGTGSERVSDALRGELEPRLAAMGATSWSKACDASVAITLMGQHGECRLDAMVQAIGEYLREQNASDRIILRLPLRGAVP